MGHRKKESVRIQKDRRLPLMLLKQELFAHVLIGLWLLLMLQEAGFDVKKPTWGRFRLEKALNCRFRPVFTHVLGLKTNQYMRKQL